MNRGYQPSLDALSKQCSTARTSSAQRQGGLTTQMVSLSVQLTEFI
jgi:hypothetical protein